MCHSVPRFSRVIYRAFFGCLLNVCIDAYTEYQSFVRKPVFSMPMYSDEALIVLPGMMLCLFFITRLSITVSSFLYDH